MEENDMIGETEENNGFYINGISYSYSILKSNYDKESLIIKLYDSANKSNIYYAYKGNISRLKKDIEYIVFSENIDEIITCLNDIFNKGNVQIKENNGEYNLILKFINSGITQYSILKLTKNDIKDEEKNEIIDKIDIIENNYKDLYGKYEELKSIKENEIRKIVKEIIFDKDIEFKLFLVFEKMLLSKYNLNNKSKNQNQIDNIEKNLMNKVKEEVNDKDDKINNQINILQKKINEDINYLNDIKQKNKNNNSNSLDNKDEKIEEEENEKEKELKPYRPELENVKSQKILMFIPPPNSPPHPRTVYFLKDPNLKENGINNKIKTEEVEITEKNYMLLYKSYSNEPA